MNKETLSFIFCFALIKPPTQFSSPITQTHTHNGQTHTNVTWRGVLAQMSYKIRNDERLGAQTKEKFPWWYGSFLGSVWKKVMKHLRRGNVRPNQRSCGQQGNVKIIRPTVHLRRNQPKVCKVAKHGNTTWLISISLPSYLPLTSLSLFAGFGKYTGIVQWYTIISM